MQVLEIAILRVVVGIGCFSNYYNLPLKELRVQGIPLKVDSGVFNQKYGTVLDSGTTYAYLPPKAFDAFKEAVSQFSCVWINLPMINVYIWQPASVDNCWTNLWNHVYWRVMEADGWLLGAGYPAARLITSCRWTRSNLPWYLLCRCWNVSNCTWLYFPSNWVSTSALL